jgi:secreted trypsin-like serine protease
MGVFFEGEPVGACSATLIDNHLVLTAAHCIENALSFGPDAAVMVSFAEDPVSIFDPNARYAVDQLIPHPKFYWGPTSNPYDIGLLILSSEVTDIIPANLPGEGFLGDLKAAGELGHGRNKTQFTIVGYGITLDWPTDSYAIIPQPRQKALSGYRSLLKAWLNLSQNAATNDGGSCFGDSGGPVFWKDAEGKETIVGITSWGDPHCVSPSFNYRVDIADSLNFINQYLVDVGN